MYHRNVRAMERAVNTRFKASHHRMQVVAVKENSCDGCYYEATNGHRVCMNEVCGECSGFVRADGKNVIFVPCSTKKQQ